MHNKAVIILFIVMGLASLFIINQKKSTPELVFMEKTSVTPLEQGGEAHKSSLKADESKEAEIVPAPNKAQRIKELQSQVDSKTQKLRELGYPDNSNWLVPGTRKYKKIIGLLVERENLKEKILEIHLEKTRKAMESIDS